MKAWISTIALGWLLASNAAFGQARETPATSPATERAAPLDLSLRTTAGVAPPAPVPGPVAIPDSVAPHFDTSTPADQFPLLPIDVALHTSSEEVKRVARWVTRTGDNARMQ